MVFTPIGTVGIGSLGFVRIGSSLNTQTRRPANGKAYLQANLESTLMFGFASGQAFDLLSVDLAEYSITERWPATISFIGYHSDGSVVATDLTTDGIIDGGGPGVDFQTFHFDSRFTDLTRVEIPASSWSLDNIAVAIPEPGISILLVQCGLWYWLRSARRKAA